MCERGVFCRTESEMSKRGLVLIAVVLAAWCLPLHSARAADAPGTSTVNLASNFTGKVTFTPTSTGYKLSVSATGLPTGEKRYAIVIYNGQSCATVREVALTVAYLVPDANGTATGGREIQDTVLSLANGKQVLAIDDVPESGATAPSHVLCAAVPIYAMGVTLNGASGSATLADAGNSTTKVSVKMSGLSANSSHSVHIHVLGCSAQGPVVAALPDIVADAQGNATASTTLNVVYTAFADGGHYIEAHVRGTKDAPPEGYAIACGNIPYNIAATPPATTTAPLPQPTMTATPTPAMPGLPNTGDGSASGSQGELPLAPFGLALSLVIIGIIAAATRRRNIKSS